MQYIFNLPTSNNTYASGNCIGGKIVISAANSPQSRIAVTDVLLIDKNSNSNAFYDLIFFDSDLTGTANDNTAFAVANTDIARVQGVLSLSGMSVLGANGGVINLSNIYKRLSLDNLSCYAVLISRATPVFSSTSNSAVTLKITTERVPL